jgi:hypothetical protein
MRKSVSSMMALWRSRASRSLRSRRSFSRAVASRSSSRPSQSSRERSAAAVHVEERVGHGGEAEAAQALGQGVDEHRASFQW